jgi:hypothetical protein
MTTVVPATLICRIHFYTSEIHDHVPTRQVFISMDQASMSGRVVSATLVCYQHAGTNEIVYSHIGITPSTYCTTCPALSFGIHIRCFSHSIRLALSVASYA